MKFINIHTHNFTANKFSVINLFPEDIETIESDRFYSIGIHPWDVSKNSVDKQLRILSETAQKETILAIGEIGLDKLHPEFNLQKAVFLKQINIAKTLNKPIIVHCVKAFSELLEILKKEDLKIPVIIHRYSGNITVAEQLLKFGCYLSFGHELFNSQSKVPKVFNKIPLENIFLETDDAEITIEEVYKKAAEIQAISVTEISEKIMSNFKTCF